MKLLSKTLAIMIVAILNLTLSQSAHAPAMCSSTLSTDDASKLRKLPTASLPTGKCRRYEGRASHYAEYFNGRSTASGEKYSSRKLTAAHRTLPFGTRVLVSNPSTGREVTVTINDRGPFVKGREIDLSSAAAKQLQMKGVGDVELEVCDDDVKVAQNP